MMVNEIKASTYRTVLQAGFAIQQSAVAQQTPEQQNSQIQLL